MGHVRPFPFSHGLQLLQEGSRLTDICASDEDDLSFCGIASTAAHLTLHPTFVQYDSECNICPDNGDCVTTKYIPAGTEVIATCWTDHGTAVLGDL